MKTLGLALAVLSVLGAVRAEAAGLTKKSYPTAAMAAKAEAANQLSKITHRYNLGGPVRASDLHSMVIGRSAGGRALRHLVSSQGILGDMKISTLRLKGGQWKAYKGGQHVGNM